MFLARGRGCHAPASISHTKLWRDIFPINYYSTSIPKTISVDDAEAVAHDGAVFRARAQDRRGEVGLVRRVRIVLRFEAEAAAMAVDPPFSTDRVVEEVPA